MKTIYQDEYRQLIDVLITARKQQNLTQDEVAKQLHKPQSYIAKIENFERKLDVLEFVALCRVLGLTPSQVLMMIEQIS
ncbi:helix-turn-helix transcriptional regulator [uncultured Moraxella sp.]|uniref:helix-turn-helix domain-containing protein n=1 Tax=uncultured Moraxella sp. TaxID=263769 RepID=UPI0025D83A8A|nr:helix-turn-helix transcriptional regulator [uncultured Moraxella sp.]